MFTQRLDDGSKMATTGTTRTFWLLARLIVVVALVGGLLDAAFPPSVAAEGLDVQQLYHMASNGQGELALQEVISEAASRGSWGPAPGDVVIFDPNLVETTRAVIVVVDTAPGECAMQKPTMQTEACQRDFTVGQDTIRFGRTAFAYRDETGSLRPRPEADDLLSTYIEEMAHSWQEYLFETEGRGTGARARVTTWEDGLYWSHGWEYQAKMYVLNLNGSVLHLSDAERNLLRGSICKDDGYANPLGYHVSAFGAPPGWPNPDGWPTAEPTPAEFEAFCAGA